VLTNSGETQTQRCSSTSASERFDSREMITAYATLKKAAANANYAGKRLNDERHS